MKHRTATSLVSCAAAITSFAALSLMAKDSFAKPPYGSGEVLAQVPAQASFCAGDPTCNGGFPEAIVVDNHRVYVSSPARGGTAGFGPSVLFVFKRSNGDTLAEIAIQGEDLSQEHALSGLALDGDHRVYALSTQLGVLRFDRHGHTYEQEGYSSPLPDLPVCGPGVPAPCSPTFLDLPPLPNEMEFDEDGYLYITDSFQATIFRVPPGGGDPEVWFQSPLLAGPIPTGPTDLPIGVNGIRVSPDRSWVYVNVSFDPIDHFTGHVYRIPLGESPDPADIELVHDFTGLFGVIPEVPDSLIFGKSGQLYVSAAAVSQIVVLGTDGSEVGRLAGPPGSPIPLDAPAGMAFDDAAKSLLVANHAILSGNAANFAVLRIRVDEKGATPPHPDCLP